MMCDQTELVPDASSKLGSPKYQIKILWIKVMVLAFIHLSAMYGLYLFLFVSMWQTVLWTWAAALIESQGITAGAHRLWCHRAYKAKLPLQIYLMLCQSMNMQYSIYKWVRDHRVHHKFTDTDADPHNVRRGFFFSHIGWQLIQKHPDVITKGKTIDVSDLDSDAVVMFQKRYYVYLAITMCWVFPTVVPWYFWGESLLVSWYVCAILRFTYTLHVTLIINSLAHIWGTKPYDKTICPGDSGFLSFFAYGDAWHNYHHVFPWDYKSSELGYHTRFNLTTMFIDLMALIGWAYDLKTATKQTVIKRAQRTGDGTRICSNDFKSI